MPSKVAVIDIGKTNAKVVVFDMAARREIALKTIQNKSQSSGSYLAFDTDGIWAFLKSALAELYRAYGYDAISITTHGACFALLNEAGELALPVMDYEDTQPEAFNIDYNAIRPAFAETGSPALPMGLNAARQIYWLSRTFPLDFAATRWILPYPQYWAHRLTEQAASEVTSLGVHTDLWDPYQGKYSSLVERLGWERLMPSLRPAHSVLETVSEPLALELGLPAPMPVYCGIHDSNASLLPHLLSRSTPFSVVSTGTWVISMTVDGEAVRLDEARDTLINVNALGGMVPSARFMGGRAFELSNADQSIEVSEDERANVLDEGIMLLPSLPAGSGPFPQAQGRWTVDSATLSPGALLYAVSLYLALMTKVSLDLTGHRGDVIVEGPFAKNTYYLEMLAQLTGRWPVRSETGLTGTSFGAACLALEGKPLDAAAKTREPVSNDPALGTYAARWVSETKTLC